MAFTLWNTQWGAMNVERNREKVQRERETKRERFLEENECFTLYYTWCTVYIDYRESVTAYSDP